MSFLHPEIESELRPIMQADPLYLVACRAMGLGRQELAVVEGFVERGGLIDRPLGSFLLNQYRTLRTPHVFVV
jgi:hypothetical protein